MDHATLRSAIYGDERRPELARMLNRLWTYSFTTKSDDARNCADLVAEAASRGFITTAIIPNGDLCGRLWKITPVGLAYLYHHADLIVEEETAYEERHSGE